MSAIILIHGGSQGGWVWSKVAPLLSQHHDLYIPTLIGMGDRVNLLDPTITLENHIEDIANIIEQHKLSNVTLVGYSYSGLIIPSVNEIFSDRIHNLIFLDSFIPQNNKTAFDILSKVEQEKWSYIANKYGDGWLMPVNEKTLDGWGVEELVLRRFLLPKITPFSINFMKTRIHLSDKFNRVKKHYIRCTEESYFTKVMRPYFDYAVSQDWKTAEIASTHVPMLTHPQELAQIFEKCL